MLTMFEGRGTSNCEARNCCGDGGMHKAKASFMVSLCTYLDTPSLAMHMVALLNLALPVYCARMLIYAERQGYIMSPPRNMLDDGGAAG